MSELLQHRAVCCIFAWRRLCTDRGSSASTPPPVLLCLCAEKNREAWSVRPWVRDSVNRVERDALFGVHHQTGDELKVGLLARYMNETFGPRRLSDRPSNVSGKTSTSSSFSVSRLLGSDHQPWRPDIQNLQDRRAWGIRRPRHTEPSARDRNKNVGITLYIYQSFGVKKSIFFPNKASTLNYLIISSCFLQYNRIMYVVG